MFIWSPVCSGNRNVMCDHTELFLCFCTSEQRGGFRGGRGRGFGARGNRSRGRIYWDTQTVHVAYWTASHQDLFHTKTDYLSPTLSHTFFLTGLHVFFTFRLAHPDCFCLFFGGGFLSSEYQTLGSDFLTCPPCAPLGQGDSWSKSKCFCPFIF